MPETTETLRDEPLSARGIDRPSERRSIGAELRAVVFLYGTVAVLAWILRGLGS